MRRLFAVAAVSALAFGSAAPVVGAELSGREIVTKMDGGNRSADESVDLTMVLLSKSGMKRTRKITMYFKSGEDSAGDRMIVRFHSPPDIRGTGFLTIEKEGAANQQWLYLPDLKKSKRVAGSSRSGSFVESDFSNYDVAPESLDEHRYKLLGEADVEGRACYKVEAIPRDDDIKETCGYSKRIMYIDKERWTLPRTEYFDKSGKLLKIADNGSWIQVKGRWRGEKVVVDNKKEGSKTFVFFVSKSRKMDRGLKTSYFSKRTLEKP